MKDLYPAREDFSRKAWINKEGYEKLYSESTKDPDAFWTAQAERIHWYAPWHTLRKVDYASASIEWYLGGKTNVAYNCIDRHLTSERRDKTAIIWEGDNPEESQRFSYSQLHEEVSLRANLLKKYGVKKGDRVVLYMPMIPDLAFFCLACSRIGAVHSVVFGGFSAEALKRRIHDCAPVMVITADGGFRGGKTIQLKAICDKALEESSVQSCLVVQRTGENVAMKPGRDTWLHEAMSDPDLRAPCPPEEMDAEDPLFILYTSGSTGNPKGILHTTGGYLVYASLTHQYIFDYHEEDVYWCTADIGWITGHSYGIYGPLCNGATTLLFEGVPNYPDWGRFWDICDKHSVSIFYTAPTAIRALAKEGDDFVRSRKRETLRVLGSVGEPIHPETWEWYHRVVGNERCPIVDTWWQTETGGILISPLPGATDLKPGSATKPFLGIEPAVVNVEGEELTGESTGFLCIKTSWPGQARGIYGNKDMFFTTYFSQFKGYYYTGDGCRRDADGYYWVTGRVDDVINVSGHRLGSAEIEAAIMEHEAVAEAAVIGIAHDIKGQGIYAYVALNSGISPSEGLKDAVRKQVRTTIGPIATPETIQWAQGLPKTRSGKIMRRILRKIAEHQEDSIGDVSTLADPSVVAALIEARARAVGSRAGSKS